LAVERVDGANRFVYNIENAEAVLRDEYPELDKKITLHLPDENNRRVGQSVAAASLT
jgi:hypothetical protein